MRAALSELPPLEPAGRLHVRSLAEGSIWASLPIIQRGIPLSYGWSVETSPHLPTLVQHNLALRSGYPGFVVRNYSLWNVKAVITSQNEGALLEALEQSGYSKLGEVGQSVVLLDQSPAPLVRPVGGGIVVGRGGYTVATVVPALSFGTSGEVQEYPDAYLDAFDLIYLYDFQYDSGLELEERIRAWLARGKVVVVDYTGRPDSALFGVAGKVIEVSGRPAFISRDPSLVPGAPVAEEPFQYQGDPWRAVTYTGLDGVVLEARDEDGETMPVIGYEELPEGKVYFIGLNLPAHALLNQDKATASFLHGFFQRLGLNVGQRDAVFQISDFQSPADDWGFRYRSDSSRVAMVSQTWSPHWQVQIDGVEVVPMNHENLIALELPAGDHQVTFHYGSTFVQWLGWALTWLAGGFLGLTLRRFRELDVLVGRLIAVGEAESEPTLSPP